MSNDIETPAADSRDGQEASVVRRLTTTATFLLIQFIAVLIHTLLFLEYAPDSAGALTWLFTGATVLAYATAYWLIMATAAALPASLVTGFRGGFRALMRPLDSRPVAAANAAAYIAAAAGLHVLLYADHFVFGVFGYHINSFVINLLTTPGGAESMDMGASAKLSFALVILGIIAANAVAWLVAVRWHAPSRPVRRAMAPWLIALLVLCAVGQGLGYGFAKLRGNREILKAAQGIPWFQAVSINSFGRKMGWAPPPGVSARSSDDALLNYPLEPVPPVTRPLNILWLVGESWRFDMLSEEISPNIWRFARTDAARFTRHYSTGVNTRMGMFGMFYGLHGNYWFPALASTRQPVLMDKLHEAGYAMQFRTSARFTYPEFKRTILAKTDPADIYERPRADVGWKLDRCHVDQMVDWLDKRPADKPFMMFMFFESPHAGYHFPDDSIIRRDYDEDFNYATDLGDDPTEAQRARIFNRYVNASHHMDRQVGILLDKLRDEGLLDSTIVIITGDHGEEFHEKGRWGHGGVDFHEEQMMVPLVVHVPGGPVGSFDGATSHLDLPATVLTALGVETSPESYGFGRDLMTGQVDRKLIIATAWDMAMCRTEGEKVIFPFKTNGLTRCATADDKPVPDENEVIAKLAPQLVDVVRQMKKYLH